MLEMFAEIKVWNEQGSSISLVANLSDFTVNLQYFSS